MLSRSLADEIEAARPHIRRLRHNGCKICIVCECTNAVHGQALMPLAQRPRLTVAEMLAFGAKIRAFAAWMADQGLELAYHHHMGTVVESPGRSTLSWRQAGRRPGSY